MESNVIICDYCQKEFNSSELAFNSVNTTVDNKEFEVVYYKCPHCAKVYVIAMLDYWGKKLQKNYVNAVDSYRAGYRAQLSPIKLQQKYEKMETLKEQAMSYQKEILHKYGELLPEELFQETPNLDN